MGFSATQRFENAGICTCQMALQLLGGGNRLKQRNAHQPPHVVILAGPNDVGIQAICAARHLANHRVQVTLAVPVKTQILVQNLALFFHTGSRLTSNTSDLPKEPVDLIIHGMFSPNEKSTNQTPSELKSACQWSNDNKAPILLLEPSANTSDVESKWSLSLGLPLIDASSGCQMYLADLAIPKAMYNAVNINYTSPFEEKLVIALNQ
ncbi:enhancer of mRNA-decapping protein 3-like [Xenia sp. Carnegie-2017]|uniref:enhancer of mRNA-decapping protein 3-like n=1 Tax=Xenia sp. Carnegie-2017 TaxID=2897299 RepID=UPI001F045205|nr:enhancer of mRNA-decapping protein 3-like [Xenia sp. Carnegie-2017]